jgi:hypothetical protein
MRKLLVLAMMLTLVCSAMAIDYGTERPDKPVVNYPVNIPNPDVLRQGGDTILSATPIVVPPAPGQTALIGTTVGYINDYDEICPYSGSTSPDVVYTFTPAASMFITVDMFGSAYDTKIYIYDQSLILVACNDDFYSDYTSRLENIAVAGGVQYFLIIDGYGGAAGAYNGYIEEFQPCVLECPAGAQIEGEPPIVDGYADAWNGGCNSPEFGNPFQPIAGCVFCGKAGYYLNASGGASRDTDWFLIVVPSGGVLEVTGDAEEATYMFELGPQDCGTVAVVQNVPIGPCAEGTMTIVQAAGSTVWYWVGPQTFWSGDTYEYDYVLWLNLVSPVENHSWTDVKSLFD